MTLNLTMPDARADLKPRITVFGVGGAGGNAVNNMIEQSLEGCEFVVANTDAQALQQAKAHAKIQMGSKVTEGLGAGALPAVGASAAEESIEEIVDHLAGAHMAFITAGMGGGTGTGAAPIIAQAARELGVLTVGVVTKPFTFEGNKRMRQAEEGIEQLQKVVDTLIIIPNQNLFRLANEKTTFTEAFAMADDVLYQGVKGVTDLMVRPGLINLDFADVRAVMNEMGKAMMGTGEAEGEDRALQAADKAIANPLLDEISLNGARGVLINVTGGYDLTLFELDEAAQRIRDIVDEDANIIVGSTLDETMAGKMRVSVVATGIDMGESSVGKPVHTGYSTPIAKTPEPAPAPEPVVDLVPEAPEEQESLSLFGAMPHQSEPAEAFDDVAMEEPAYRPAPRPAALADVRHAPAPRVSEVQEAATGAEYVAPKPRPVGAPTPEALERLRVAIQNERPRAATTTPAARAPTEQSRPRFGGINTLINRMTGHGEEDHQPSPVERRAPAPQMRSSAPPPRADAPVDPDKERIEIPAFLRRQAN